MDLSALDNALSTLESQISGVERQVDGLEKWLWISSLAVIVGVALELYFVIHAYKENRREWAKGYVRPPDKPSMLILGCEMAGVILVVLGIAGELGVGILSSNANSRLRTLNNSRLQLVRDKANVAALQAGDAKTSAIQSANAAGSAVTSAQTTKREVAAIHADLVGVTTDLEAAKQIAGDTLNAIKTEANARSRIEKDLLPRSAGTNGLQNCQLLLALSENLTNWAYYAAFPILRTARSSRLLTASRLALSSR